MHKYMKERLILLLEYCKAKHLEFNADILKLEDKDETCEYSEGSRDTYSLMIHKIEKILKEI